MKSKDRRTLSTVFIAFSLILAAFSLWQLSFWVHRQFNVTCQFFSYNDCMKYYFQQTSYYKFTLAIAVVVFIATSVLAFARSSRYSLNHHRS